VWPWEHLAVGYLGAALLVRLRYGRSLTHREAIAVALATQYPDLLDKPLGWVFGIFPSGLSIGHSLVVGLPLVAVVVVLTRRRGRPALGEAVSVAYLLHPPADALYGVLLGGEFLWSFMLWPLLPQPPATAPVDTVAYVLGLVERFLVALGTPAGVGYVVFEITLLAVALALWTRDGRPGLPAL